MGSDDRANRSPGNRNLDFTESYHKNNLHSEELMRFSKRFQFPEKVTQLDGIK
jgi:hypothetical protein